jgi:hypothetical protein
MTLEAYEITQEHKDNFIELLYAGLRPNDAAHEIGTTGTKFKYFKNPKSIYYDAEFAARWHEAITSDEHRRAFEDNIRDQLTERAKTSDAILTKMALVHLPEYEPLRHQNFKHDVNVNLIARYLPQDVLEAAIEAAEQDRDLKRGEMKLLPAPTEETA